VVSLRYPVLGVDDLDRAEAFWSALLGYRPRAGCAVGGARVAGDAYPDDAGFVVVEDTEGNRCCLVDVDHPVA